MGCGCKGAIPRQVRNIHRDQYELQHGQYISDVCHVFGIPTTRWQELVGANLHKPLEEKPEYGSRHRCFKTLEAGERLNVPGCWLPGTVSGPDAGSVGAPVVSRRRPVRMVQRRAIKAVPKNSWADRHPEWAGSIIAYMSQRIWSFLEFNAETNAKFKEAVNLGMGKLQDWMQAWVDPDEFYRFMEYNVHCHGWDSMPSQMPGSGDYQPGSGTWYKDIWFADAEDVYVLAMAGSIYARVVPGCPGGPPYAPTAGSVGQPMQPLSPLQEGVTIDQLTTMIDTVNQLGVPNAVANILAAGGQTLPSGVDYNDAIAVVYSWWPYITNWPNTWPGSAPPPLPTPSNPLPVDFNSMVAIVRQAVEFLRASGIKDGFSNVVQMIPWDSIDWANVPWKAIQDGLRTLSQSMAKTPIPPWSTPPKGIPDQAPNFFASNWNEQSWIEMLKDVEFTDSLSDLLGDEDAVACIKADPDRLKKLSKCGQCYDDTEQFKKILCASEPADPCDCDEPSEPKEPKEPKEPTEPVAAKADNTALIVGGVVVGVLGIAATAALLGGGKK